MSTPTPIRASALTQRLDEEKRALLMALATVNGHIPKVVVMLAKDQLPVAKEREFAGLLISLGELLCEHANNYAEQQVSTRKNNITNR